MSEEYTNQEIVERTDKVKAKFKEEEVLEGAILALFSTTELIEEVKRRVKQW